MEVGGEHWPLTLLTTREGRSHDSDKNVQVLILDQVVLNARDDTRLLENSLEDICSDEAGPKESVVDNHCQRC